MLVDEAKIFVQSGKGGDGIVAFRREKYVPMGGPAGGDGGRGGHVVFIADPNINSLYYFRKNSHFKAKPGNKGGSSRKTGANAPDLEVRVPLGTIVRHAETKRLIADLVQPQQRIVILEGGRGGKGNARFATAANRSPRIAEKGAPAESAWVTLELKLIADVGLVGVPNAGKSTLLSVISNAKPKIADYPFTTLEPNLGVVVQDHRDLVVADIPGLIEGAHMGVGLGHSFLRHVQRTRVLVHLLDGGGDDPIADYNQINSELALFDENLADKPQIVVMNKYDLPQAQERWETVQEALGNHGISPIAISAATHHNVQGLIQQIFQAIDDLPDETPEPIVETPVYELQEPEQPFTIERGEEGEFLVIGKRIERAAAMTYWEYDEAVQRFQKILEAVGVSQALKDEGVQPGDTVFIGDYELEWSD